MEKLARINERITPESRQSPETSANTPPVPDDQTAAVISSLIDRARSAMGWNALPQTSVRGEQSPQDLAIFSWYEICVDAGMHLEQYTPCFRAAQQRKRELLAQGQQLTVITPYDLCAELDKVRQMHAELDGVKMLSENAPAACQRCFGTGFQRMANGTVKPGCTHVPMTPEEEAALKESRVADAEFVKDKATLMREALKKIGSPKPPPAEVQPKRQQGTPLYCTNPECGRSKRPVSSLFFAEGGTCKDLLNRGDYDDLAEMKLCDGVFINRGNHA